MATCSRCPAEWQGFGMAHCFSCCQTFGVVSSFDMHRRNGYCLKPARAGLHQDERGIWRQASREETE